MHTTICDNLNDVAQEVLESLLFAFTDKVDPIPDRIEVDSLVAKVEFTGARHGLLTVIAPESLCCEWSETMTSEQSPTKLSDMIAELSNIIAGHWVSRQFSGEAIMLLPPTVARTCEAEPTRILDQQTSIALSVDGVPIFLSVELSSATAPQLSTADP